MTGCLEPGYTGKFGKVMARVQNFTNDTLGLIRIINESSFRYRRFFDIFGKEIFVELASPEGDATSSSGAVEKTRTSTGLPPQAPQACASTIPPRPHRDKRAALGDTARVKGAIADD